MNGAKRSAEAVGCKNASVGEGSTRASSGRRSENVGLSKANLGENPMPRKPKGSSAVGESGPKIRPKRRSRW